MPSTCGSQTSAIMSARPPSGSVLSRALTGTACPEGLIGRLHVTGRCALECKMQPDHGPLHQRRQQTLVSHRELAAPLFASGFRYHGSSRTHVRYPHAVGVFRHNPRYSVEQRLFFTGLNRRDAGSLAWIRTTINWVRASCPAVERQGYGTHGRSRTFSLLRIRQLHVPSCCEGMVAEAGVEPA